MNPRVFHYSHLWSKEWGLTAFLVLLILMVFIIGPVASLTSTGPLLITSAFSLLLITGVATVVKRRSLTLITTGLVAATLALRWLAHLVPEPALLSASAVLSIACLGLLTVVVLFQVFGAGPITAHRIQGAVAAYLLLGLVWAFAYELILIQNPASFQPADLGGAKTPVMVNLIYFSFVTLTTVGYGDITPVHPMARSLSNLEALVGLLYPAILIGRIVAMELEYRRSK